MNIAFLPDRIRIASGVSSPDIHRSRKYDERYGMETEKMVREQIEERGVRDKNVLDAMIKVRRHLFIPDEDRQYAYRDHPLPIGHGQTISQPYIVAYMTEKACIGHGSKVLEIGTGSGYQAAVLGAIVREVYTVELIGPLYEKAVKTFQTLGYTNIFCRHGNGYEGWPEQAPFDAVVVTAAPPSLPEKLIEQLRTGGRMVIPVGGISQELLVVTRTDKGYIKENLLPVRFVPMVEPQA